MKIRPSGIPAMETTPTCVKALMPVTKNSTPFRGRSSDPGVNESPSRDMELEVHKTSKWDISSTKTAALGRTRATKVIISGWPVKELSSFLQKDEYIAI